MKSGGAPDCGYKTMPALALSRDLDVGSSCCVAQKMWFSPPARFGRRITVAFRPYRRSLPEALDSLTGRWSAGQPLVPASRCCGLPLFANLSQPER